MLLIKFDITSILLFIIYVVLFNNTTYFGLDTKYLLSFLRIFSVQSMISVKIIFSPEKTERQQ